MARADKTRSSSYQAAVAAVHASRRVLDHDTVGRLHTHPRLLASGIDRAQVCRSAHRLRKKDKFEEPRQNLWFPGWARMRLGGGEDDATHFRPPQPCERIGLHAGIARRSARSRFHGCGRPTVRGKSSPAALPLC